MNIDRQIFNYPIRKCTTLATYPDKLTIDEFKEIIVNLFEVYQNNTKQGKFDNPKYIEEWVEQYLTWLEIERSSGD